MDFSQISNLNFTPDLPPLPPLPNFSVSTSEGTLDVDLPQPSPQPSPSRRSRKRARQKAKQSQKTQASAKPRVMVLSLGNSMSFLKSMYHQLFLGLHKNATVTEVSSAQTAEDALTTPSPPSAVLIIDSGITTAEHSGILSRLIGYAHAGGRVVLGGQFAGDFDYREGPTFWRKWGVSWQLGSYYVTSFELNYQGVPAPLDAHALDQQCHFKATFIRGHHSRDAVYTLALHAPMPPNVAKQLGSCFESPAVWTKIGKGYLGFCGAANTEASTIRLLIEMCGVRLQPGDLGPERHLASVEIGPVTSYVRSVYETVPEQKNESKGKMSLRPGSREAQVAVRAVVRERTALQKRAKGEEYKETGNKMFKIGEYGFAADMYREAAREHAPKPVYLANLAAALLKLERWDLAESAADRALRGDPANLKARYRRGLARKGMGRYLDAIKDFRCVLQHEPSAADAQRELVATLALLTGPVERAGEEDPPFDRSCEWEVATQSDTEDYRHCPPSNRPCRAYNHEGCTHRAACPYVHAPDWRSTRDRSGRNVCLWWLLGGEPCPWDEFYKDGCPYAHDETHLPNPWWSKEYRLFVLRTQFYKLDPDAVEEIDRLFWQNFVMSWRADLWETEDWVPETELEPGAHVPVPEAAPVQHGFGFDNMQDTGSVRPIDAIWANWKAEIQPYLDKYAPYR